MIKLIALNAFELDGWLHTHVGGWYGAALRWGLVVSIIGNIGTLRQGLAAGGLGVGAMVTLVLQSALLINQLAQWHELNERKRARRGRG